MLDDHDFAIDCLFANRLPFVEYAEPTNDGTTVIVKLTAMLTDLLPANRCIIQIARHDFSLEEVIRVYEINHVKYLEEVASIARKLLRESKRQMNR